MYYAHFGLKEPPFKITPNTDFFFSGANRGAVLDALVYAIANGEGIIKVVGEVGSGKTMLCRMLQSILPEKIESIYLANPSVAPEDVLHAIAFELQLKLPKNADRLKVMQQLQAHLLDRHAEGRQVVIFVEEAQGMPLATLEEIRLLSNLETKQDKLLQIVLFGQPELDDNLSKAHIRQLRERITHSFHLEPLGTKEIGEYLSLRLRAAGYHGPHLFSEAAIKKLSSAAKGLARRVNILADKSLLAAFADNVYQVTPKHVKAAIQDSEFGRHTARYQQHYVWAIILLVFLMGALGYTWWQSSSKVKPMTSLGAVENKTAKTLVVKKAVITAEPQAEKIINSVVTHDTNLKSNNTGAESEVVSPIVPPPSSTIATNVLPPMTKAGEVPVKPILEIKKSLVERRLEVTKNWLFSGQPSTITIQIKSLPTEVKLDGELERMSQQIDIDNIYLYQKQQNGHIYNVILYGQFSQRSDALAALNNLPASIKNNRPYLRTLAGINRDVE